MSMKGRIHVAKKFMVLILGFMLSFSLAGCAPLVKTDLKSFDDNPEEYKGKELIFTADIKTVVEHPEAYAGKQVELKGYVTYNGFRGFTYWNFLLKDDEGLSVRCYEDEYRVDVWNWPDMVVKRAERKHDHVAVVGKFEKGRGIELRWIEYDGQTISTDYKPPSIIFPVF
jgi:hypothetical protein